MAAKDANPTGAPAIVRAAGLVLLALGIGFLLWSALRKIELSEPAITLTIVGFAGLLIAELLPRIKSLKLSATGVDIDLKDLSESFTNQILELKKDLGDLAVPSGGGAPATLRERTVGWKEPPKELIRPGAEDDDTRKGQFGGRREVNGLRLEAEFPRSTREWAEVRLTVRDKGAGDLPPVSAVEFFLDSTFDVPRVKVPMIDGKAQLTITSWGGFTVGVWAPERDTALELDLSKLRNAPRVIKEE